jgi:hypothetical protein
MRSGALGDSVGKFAPRLDELVAVLVSTAVIYGAQRDGG